LTNLVGLKGVDDEHGSGSLLKASEAADSFPSIAKKLISGSLSSTMPGFESNEGIAPLVIEMLWGWRGVKFRGQCLRSLSERTKGSPVWISVSDAGQTEKSSKCWGIKSDIFVKDVGRAFQASRDNLDENVANETLRSVRLGGTQRTNSTGIGDSTSAQNLKELK
jgi:hypothetical protein